MYASCDTAPECHLLLNCLPSGNGTEVGSYDDAGVGSSGVPRTPGTGERLLAFCRSCVTFTGVLRVRRGAGAGVVHSFPSRWHRTQMERQPSTGTHFALICTQFLHARLGRSPG